MRRQRIWRDRGALAERLERRALLDAAIAPASSSADTASLEQDLERGVWATPLYLSTASPLAGGSSPNGLTPAQIRGAYGLGQYGASPIQFGASHIQGDGTGQTVAIVDAYNYPTAATD